MAERLGKAAGGVHDFGHPVQPCGADGALRARRRVHRRAWRRIATRMSRVARRCWAASSRSRSRTSRTARWRWSEIEAAIKERRPASCADALLAIENTFGGRVMPQSWIWDATALARRQGLARISTGRGVFNAAVAGNVDAARDRASPSIRSRSA